MAQAYELVREFFSLTGTNGLMVFIAGALAITVAVDLLPR